MIPIVSHFYALIFDDADKVEREIGISIGLGQIDRKMQQKINEKKQAHGLKPSM